ncbi:hypothetical protein GCM10011588_19750 [Nocardia jinanensis]|uniref:Uncharacterized protein n=2 Tax=Nocardia jinanensis TaxID=382504 RepID=A0A917RGC8_9NOCA|nr:hypothetical protein GCM10011588_19750 [Nocardia jinanensis]
MTRYAHFVGSLPRELMTGGDRGVLDWFAAHTDGRPVTAIPCDLDPDWILAYLQDLGNRTDALEVLRPGGFDGYSDFPTYGVRSGRALEPGDVSMNRVERIGEAVTAFESFLRDRPELAGTKLQLSQPHPLDLAMFVHAGGAVASGLPMGLALRRSNLALTALRQLPVFTEAVLQEMREVRRRHGDLIVWQVETPISLLSMVKAQQLGALWALAPVVAGQLAGFLEKVRDVDREHGIETETIVHLCYGDYQHESLLSPRNLAPAVALLNRTGRRLVARGVPVPRVHIPCAYGAHPAPVDPEFYAPLRGLGPEWRVIAGVVSTDDPDRSAQALSLFEQARDNTAYGVAAACGFGRNKAEEAEQGAATIASLVRAPEGSRG